MSRFTKIILWILAIFTGTVCLIDLIAIPFYFIDDGVLEGITALVYLALIIFWEVIYIYILWSDKKKEGGDKE